MTERAKTHAPAVGDMGEIVTLCGITREKRPPLIRTDGKSRPTCKRCREYLSRREILERSKARAAAGK